MLALRRAIAGDYEEARGENLENSCGVTESTACAAAWSCNEVQPSLQPLDAVQLLICEHATLTHHNPPRWSLCFCIFQIHIIKHIIPQISIINNNREIKNNLMQSLNLTKTH